MRIIEQSIIAKSPTIENEDGLVATADFIAVIDGCTSKSSAMISPTMTNGRFCMSLTGEYLRHIDKKISCREFCEGVTQHIMRHFDSDIIPNLSEHPEERPTASCIIYSNYQKQVWMIGDCQCLIDEKHYDNPKPDEAMIAAKRSVYAKKLIETGIATVNSLRIKDISRHHIISDIITSMKGQNIEYSVIDGFPIPIQQVQIVQIPTTTKTIVLASDGYPFLKPTLFESESALRNQLDSDPLNINSYKATKGFMAGNNSFDDRTYIRFNP